MRRNLTALFVVGALCLTAGAARANGGTNDDCHTVTVCKKKAKRKPKKAPPPAAAETSAPTAPSTFCPPAEKPACPAPPAPEVQVVTVVQKEIVKEYIQAPAPEYFNVGLGMMGNHLWGGVKDRSWAWGPALQFRFRMAPRTEFTLDAGFGGGADTIRWSPGKTRSWMAQASIAHYVRPWLGLKGGVYVEEIGVKPGWENGSYIGFTPGLVLRFPLGPVTFRLEGTGFVGGTSYQNSSATSLVLGGTGSGFISINWK